MSNKPPVSMAEISEAADRGAKKRKETPDAALGRIMRLNRAQRRALAQRTMPCVQCGTRIKPKNVSRHAAKHPDKEAA